MLLELNKIAKPTNKWAEYVPLCVLDNMEAIDMVGSYYTCDPKPDTDIDVLCLLKPDKGIIADGLAPLLQDGWFFQEGYGLDEGEFTSMKKKGSKVNLILTNKKEFFDKFIVARNVCKLLNIMDKKQRCEIHNLIMKHKKAF
jgi:hypothetical protein